MRWTRRWGAGEGRDGRWVDGSPGARLSVEGLSAGYHGHPVVRDINLTVGAGEVVALVGPNGAGKTTTLMAISGALTPVAGTVRIMGRAETRPLHMRARAGMGFVPETRAAFMQLTTKENLSVGRCDTARALSLFPELLPLLGRKAGDLSGGEQQILTLARTLARRPTLLLADELSLGLAPLITTRLLIALRRAADSDGIGVLLVEQHVHQALRYADRLYVLQRGHITRSGRAADLVDKLEGMYLAGPSEYPAT
jgi:branched-chain amino acid transport system ATP-binding protein